jgi:hypothetical protein
MSFPLCEIQEFCTMVELNSPPTPCATLLHGVTFYRLLVSLIPTFP